MKEYKVWIHIEECDEDEYEYEDVSEPIDVAVCDTLEEAESVVAFIEEKLEGLL